MIISRKTIIFQGFREGPTFSKGEGPTFSRGVGGRNANCMLFTCGGNKEYCY